MKHTFGSFPFLGDATSWKDMSVFSTKIPKPYKVLNIIGALIVIAALVCDILFDDLYINLAGLGLLAFWFALFFVVKICKSKEVDWLYAVGFGTICCIMVLKTIMFS